MNMTPENFLEIAREMANIQKQPDGTYFIYDYGAVNPFFHARRVPELEKQLGPNALVCESLAFHSDPFGYIVYDVYFIQNGIETIMKFIFHKDNVLWIDALNKQRKWSYIKVSKVEKEKQIVLTYLSEDPRFRLLFVTGIMKMKEE